MVIKVTEMSILQPFLRLRGNTHQGIFSLFLRILGSFFLFWVYNRLFAIFPPSTCNKQCETRKMTMLMFYYCMKSKLSRPGNLMVPVESLSLSNCMFYRKIMYSFTCKQLEMCSAGDMYRKTGCKNSSYLNLLIALEVCCK
jgi:hypothetical protein